MVVSKNEVPLFGGSFNKDANRLGSTVGPVIFGNSRMLGGIRLPNEAHER